MAFQNCTSLENINIPQSVTFIGENAFIQCENLKSIDIPGNINTIEGAFFNCYNLKNINISEGVKIIKSYAFYSCNANEINIPNSVIYIGCRTLPSASAITLPESIKYIDPQAFEYPPQVVYCVKGSYADSFATEKGYNVEYIENGDINCDLTIDIKDLIRLKKSIADGAEKSTIADFCQTAESTALTSRRCVRCLLQAENI